MNGNVYRVHALQTSSLLQRCFGQVIADNAVIEINNLLATKTIRQISTQEIRSIEHRYKLRLNLVYPRNLEEFYAVYLNHCLADRHLDNEELDTLRHLQHILGLNDKQVEQLHIWLGETLYRQSFKDAVADGRLTREEEQFLARLEGTLRLPKALADKISAETRAAFVQDYVAGILTHKHLSPEEEQELQAIATSLRVSLQFNTQTQEQLHKLKRYWALENLDLPVISADTSLQRGEQCYFKGTNVTWYEERSAQRTGASYSSFSSIQQVYLQPGRLQAVHSRAAMLKHIDRGSVYLTDKRVFFTGAGKNAQVRFEKITGLQPYADGLRVEKETGKHIVIQLPQHADICCLTLERLLRGR
ncbi:hypothetical protein [Taibaiella koreensis]|uniref:hypothetical protein n=1 Tax=Taibaiella koreensis TaxID=1268548 RepID=UPI0013C2B38D|nr:hypothetical protein [Taibaiella koreensis]